MIFSEAKTIELEFALIGNTVGAAYMNWLIHRAERIELTADEVRVIVARKLQGVDAQDMRAATKTWIVQRRRLRRRGR